MTWYNDSMSIVIQSTNFYTFNKDPRQTLRAARKHSHIRRADSIGGQEGGRPLSHGLKRFKGYKTFWKRSTNRHVKNNPILVRKGKRFEFLGKKWFKTADGTGRPTTPQRNVYVVFYRKGPVKIAHLNTHFHVVPEEDLAGKEERQYGETAKQYVEHVKFVRQLMQQYKREGYIVFVTADGNTRPRQGVDDWKYSAYVYLARGKFNVTRHVLDIIVHDSELVRKVNFEIVDQKHLGAANHDTLIGEYEVRT